MNLLHIMAEYDKLMGGSYEPISTQKYFNDNWASFDIESPAFDIMFTVYCFNRNLDNVDGWRVMRVETNTEFMKKLLSVHGPNEHAQFP